MSNDGKWKLSYGIHNGTFSSRDRKEIPNLDSLQACRSKINELEQYYENMGCVIWFANAIGPNHENQAVHAGNVNYHNPMPFSEMKQGHSTQQNPRDQKRRGW